ncbi:MAG TPA: DUF1772 domain-containing protein [Beijerinckiaceae bacterium]|nr:DUF1772 domain-containing protein [Beijerinckiaceae bacterium]
MTLAAMFCGIALYINLAEQPARLALADAPLLEQWKVSFGVALLLQSALAMASGVAGLATWWTHRDWRWAAGGLLMLANWPWTLLVIAPINNALLAISAASAGPVSRALIEQWGVVHAGRTAISIVAVALFISAIARSIKEATGMTRRQKAGMGGI